MVDAGRLHAAVPHVAVHVVALLWRHRHRHDLDNDPADDDEPTDQRSETPRSSHAATANSIHAPTTSGRGCSGNGSALGRTTRNSRPQIITRAAMTAPTGSFALMVVSCHQGTDTVRSRVR